MKLRTRLGFALGSLGLIAGGIAVAAPAASAATVCAPLTTTDHTFASPIHLEQSLDAIGWGGSGSRLTACTGAVVNDNIKTFQYSSAGVAADFTPVATSATTFQLVYTPGNEVSTTAPLCVSTVLDQRGVFARLRPCAGLAVTVSTVTGNATIVPGAGNQWQNFRFSSVGDGFSEITATQEPAPGPFSLNIAGYGGNGTQVISWTPFATCTGLGCAENQIFEVLPAA